MDRIINPQEKRIPVLTPCKAIVGRLRGESIYRLLCRAPHTISLAVVVESRPPVGEIHQKGKEEKLEALPFLLVFPGRIN